ncbi:hypothetical protein BC939DRAFT_472306 [Gamsiella multidivaricata]|uniref:uncharacterized protein n=1 Tax=Gamsiella multidivaricata TaxID=101098 RepID=UPI0022201BFB|nr:uncharacterized protein BC939DRAFT_472306 [Gamsiella multidivaricata]KAI7832719.1 hypothetical protein BC939DRAFT_472306 [Gamsiella multidivaricata]
MVVITYCVEYAQSQKSVCLKCNKVIPNKSLRVGRMERQSEKEKKKFAKFRWYHFKCFEIPEIMTKIPVHLIRGQVDLLDKDKVRLERVIKLGVGASWSQIVEQHKKKAQEDADAAAAEALANGTPLPTPSSKSIDSDDDENDDDGNGQNGGRDFTAQLTGEVDRKQERKNRKVNKLKAKTEGAKVEKKKQQNQKGAAVSASGTKSSSSSSSSNNNKSAGASKGGKEMSAVEKAIAASRADSKKKMEQMQNKFGKK